MCQSARPNLSAGAKARDVFDANEETKNEGALQANALRSATRKFFPIHPLALVAGLPFLPTSMYINRGYTVWFHLVSVAYVLTRQPFLRHGHNSRLVCSDIQRPALARTILPHFVHEHARCDEGNYGRPRWWNQVFLGCVGDDGSFTRIGPTPSSWFGLLVLAVAQSIWWHIEEHLYVGCHCWNLCLIPLVEYRTYFCE